MYRPSPAGRVVQAGLFVLTILVTAQPTAAIDANDIADIAAVTLGADPAALLDQLETPPRDRRLPDGFTNPEDDEPRHADLIEDIAPDFSGMPGLIGTVALPFDTDRDVIDGALSAGILTYVVSSVEITPADLESLAGAVAEGFEQEPPPGTTAEVDQRRLEGIDALIVTIVNEDDGAEAVIQHIVMPVGNTLVIGTVVVADQGAVRERPVRRHAEDLLLAGVDHLGRVAEDVPEREPTNVL